MWKKVLSTKGIMWQHRFAVLTKDRLCFTKDESDPEIMDYIPLHEISTINLHEVHPEDETNSRNSSRPTGTGADNNPRDTNQERLPLEKHLIIATEEGGHNGGRRYFHRLESKESDGWMADLKESVKGAKLREHERFIQENYGHSTIALCRVKSLQFYESSAFQLFVAALIITGVCVCVCMCACVHVWV